MFNTIRMIAKFLNLLTLKNIKRLASYLWLFGLNATYKAAVEKLRANSFYVVSKSIKGAPLVGNRRTRREPIPTELVRISIVIPVKNGGSHLRRLLSSFKNQRGFHDSEIIVVDSGSTDDSLRISQEFEAKILEVPPEEFSHSYVRNMGAELATGDYILFTVQDALPPTDLWLYELYCAIRENEVVAVSCAEFPREDSDLFYRVGAWHFRRTLEIDKQDRVMCKPDNEDYFALRKNGLTMLKI
jgi:cellulose synthase/poly-beta-1,6-N-acetylglucosamine synthase-like glycosyltransferase